MADEPRATATALLQRWRGGDKASLDALMPSVYGELRRVARARLKAEVDHSLQPTALVHEVYLRLVELDRMTIRDRAHFFALAARLMRQILVDYARRKKAGKRGGAATITGLAELSSPPGPAMLDVLALDLALRELSSFDERACRIVELKFFAGLTIDEAAEALDVSAATVERDWTVAKAWLMKHLSSPA